MESKQSPFSIQLKTEDKSEPMELSYGTVVVGRGPLLGVRDKQVSRKHAELVVDSLTDVLLIHSVSSNPTFVRKLGTEKTVVLSKEEKVQLCPGDSFSFLPEGPEFTVQSSRKAKEAHIEQTLDYKMMQETQEQTINYKMAENPIEQTLDYKMLEKQTEQTLDCKVTEDPIEQTLDYKMMEKPLEQTLESNIIENPIEQTLHYKMVENNTEQGSDGEEPERATEQTLAYSMADAEEAATLEIDYNETVPIDSPVNHQASPVTDLITSENTSPPTEPITPNHTSPPTEPLTPNHTSPSEPPENVSPPTEPLVSDHPSLSSESSNKRKRKLPSWMLDGTSEEGSEKISKKASFTNKNPIKPKQKAPDPKPCSSTSIVTKGDAHSLTTDIGLSSPKPESSEASKEEDPTLPLCQYGSSCYRNNPDHLKSFYHPPTTDDTAAVKKECPYGSQCYRKNPDHFKEFSHSPKQSSDRRRREKKPRAAKAKKRSALDGASDDDGETNAYNLKDDFIDDSGGSSESSSTEFESSEGEEWQPDGELGSLVDEANSFVKNPKMIKKV